MSLDNFVDELDEDHLRASKYIKSALELLSTAGVWIIETVRAELVHPEVGHLGQIRRSAGYHQPIPLLSPETNPGLYGVLQHSGNFHEGFGYTAFSYIILSHLFPRMKEKYALITSIAGSNLFIAAYESGLLNSKIPDYPDIPAAIVGSVAFLGLHKLLSNYLPDKSL